MYTVMLRYTRNSKDTLGVDGSSLPWDVFRKLPSGRWGLTSQHPTEETALLTVKSNERVLYDRQ